MANYDPSITENEEETETKDNPTPFQQLRKHARDLEKSLKAREDELDELRKFRAESETRQKNELLKAAFEQVGLTAKQAELFSAARPDAEPTVEAVRTFAQEYGFIDAPEAEEKDDDKSADEGSFAPTPQAGVPPHKARMSSDQFWELHKKNPVAAMKAAQEGRVDFKTTL